VTDRPLSGVLARSASQKIATVEGLPACSLRNHERFPLARNVLMIASYTKLMRQVQTSHGCGRHLVKSCLGLA
jgi:hypothetical protein